MRAFVVSSLLLTLSPFGRSEQVFDYVIVGGGTAGLTVAARLSEDPVKSVLVLEAGEDKSEDINVLAPNLLTTLYGKPEYDWNYHTVPQPHANNKAIAHPRGKQLGGSSAINFLWWTHASQKDIDNWGLLGNANWSWDALQPYYTKSEHYIQPSRKTVAALQTEYIEPDIHGDSGPILNTFPGKYGPLDIAWPRTYKTLGLAVSSDPRDGLALGGYTNLINMDPKSRSRSYAATTYLQAAKKRSNFNVVTGAHAQQILFDRSRKTPRATGVSYSVNGTSQHVLARTEVILSAGAFGSPQLLELSGIGDAKILEKYGVTTVLDNAAVGENLQDHAYVPIGYKVREPGTFTLDNFADETFFNEAYDQYVANRTGWLATTSASSGLLSLAQSRKGMPSASNLDQTLQKYCHQKPTYGQSTKLSLLCDDVRSEAISQEFSVPGGINPKMANDSSQLFFADTPGNFMTINGVLEHPFSRGSVHIGSADPQEYPILNPNYLSHSLDIELLSVITLHLQKVASTPPLSDLLVNNGTAYQPGYHKLTASNVEAWIRDNLQSEYHPCGTCAMLPRDKGGVIDNRFNVYGVQGLRVVDASIFPLIPRANLQSLVYAIAERAADFIKEDAQV